MEIPERIRRAAAEGAVPEEDQGAVVLTPPGAGGDSHGDASTGAGTPTPPGPGTV